MDYKVVIENIAKDVQSDVAAASRLLASSGLKPSAATFAVMGLLLRPEVFDQVYKSMDDATLREFCSAVTELAVELA